MEAEFNAGIYCIINTINNKKYVGSSTNIKQRWMKHKSELRNGYHINPHLQKAWNKYGEEKFDFRVLVYTNPDEAILLEQYVLDNYFELFEYNISKDANAPMAGREFSEEHRRKLSESHIGKTFSEETKQKMSKARIGKTFSKETCKKLSEANTGKNNPFFGKRHTEQTRNKISEANSGKNCSQETRKKMSASRSGDKNHKWINFSDEKIYEMRLLREQGYSYEEIAGVFGISYNTVRRRLKNK